MRSVLLFIVPFIFSGFTATGIRTFARWASAAGDDPRRYLVMAASAVVFILAPVAGLLLFASVAGDGSAGTKTAVFLIWFVPICVYVAKNWDALKSRLGRG